MLQIWTEYACCNRCIVLVRCIKLRIIAYYHLSVSPHLLRFISLLFRFWGIEVSSCVNQQINSLAVSRSVCRSVWIFDEMNLSLRCSVLLSPKIVQNRCMLQCNLPVVVVRCRPYMHNWLFPFHHQLSHHFCFSFPISSSFSTTKDVVTKDVVTKDLHCINTIYVPKKTFRWWRKITFVKGLSLPFTFFFCFFSFFMSLSLLLFSVSLFHECMVWIMNRG